MFRFLHILLGTCHKVSTTGGGGYSTLTKIFFKAPIENEYKIPWPRRIIFVAQFK